MQWDQVIKATKSNYHLASMNRIGVMVSYIGENYRWAKYEIDEVAAYDIDLSSSWSPKESQMILVAYGDSGLTYLLAHGYPYAPIYGNSDVDRFITQAAVWWYLAELGINSLSKSFISEAPDPYGLRFLIRRLVDAARDMRNMNVGGVYTIGDKPLMACVFADNGSTTPHIISLVCPNDYARNKVSDVEAIDLASELVSSGSMQSSLSLNKQHDESVNVAANQFIIIHKGGKYHIALGGVGLSNQQLNNLVDRQIKRGRLPVGVEFSVSILPSAPTREMLAIGSTATAHDTNASAGFMVEKAINARSKPPQNLEKNCSASIKRVSKASVSNGSNHYVFRIGDKFES